MSSKSQFFTIKIVVNIREILSCDVWFSFWGEISKFPITCIIVQKIQESVILCEGDKMLVTWLFGINSNINSPSWCHIVAYTNVTYFNLHKIAGLKNVCKIYSSFLFRNFICFVITKLWKYSYSIIEYQNLLQWHAFICHLNCTKLKDFGTK